MLVTRKKHELAIDLLRRMRETFKDSNSLALTNLAAAIPDRILFVEIRFDEALERMQTNKEGADAFFLDCLAKLAANPQAGPQAFRQILDAAQFYEQTGRFLNAKDIYQLLDREMARNRDPLIARSAKEAAERGLARMDSLGREVQVAGTLPDGKAVDSDSLRGQFVVLYFWRGQMPAESYQSALELNAVVRNYRDAGVVFLGIGADSDTPAQAEATFKKVPAWHLQLAEHLAAVGKLEVDLGIPKAPYVTILDKEGKVCAINVSPLQLKPQLDRLLRRR
jgi:peroxiredoxin